MEQLTGARSPAVPVQLPQQVHKLVADQLRVTGQEIEADRMLFVRRVEQHHVVNSLRRYLLQDGGDEVALRLDHDEPASGLDVLSDEALEEYGFSRPRGSDHMQVLTGVPRRELNNPSRPG